MKWKRNISGYFPLCSTPVISKIRIQHTQRASVGAAEAVNHGATFCAVSNNPELHTNAMNPTGELVDGASKRFGQKKHVLATDSRQQGRGARRWVTEIPTSIIDQSIRKLRARHVFLSCCVCAVKKNRQLFYGIIRLLVWYTIRSGELSPTTQKPGDPGHERSVSSDDCTARGKGGRHVPTGCFVCCDTRESPRDCTHLTSLSVYAYLSQYDPNRLLAAGESGGDIRKRGKQEPSARHKNAGFGKAAQVNHNLAQEASKTTNHHWTPDKGWIVAGLM